MIEKAFRVIDGFDCENNPCKLIENTITNERFNTENTLEANSLCEELNWRDERINDLYWSNEDLLKDNEILEAKNEQLKKELVKFKEWEKHIRDVKREDLDKVFNLSIYEIAEGFQHYKERIKELEEENASMKGRILNAMAKSNQIECDCRSCVCEDYVTKELKKWCFDE